MSRVMRMIGGDIVGSLGEWLPDPAQSKRQDTCGGGLRRPRWRRMVEVLSTDHQPQQISLKLARP